MRNTTAEEKTALARLEHAARSQIMRASWLTAVSALIWLAQAALVAVFIADLLQGDGAPSFALIGGFVALGLLRAGLGVMAEGILHASARNMVARLRDTIIHKETTRAQSGAFGGAGAVAALGSSKLDLLIPYVTRYRPARMRVLLVPPVILVLSFWHAWVVGLVLLVAGPLIPVFMALVGHAAKEASARQLGEIGTLNDLLVERFAGLVDIRALGAGAQVAGSFATKAEYLRKRTMAVLAVAFLSSTVLELFSALGVALVAVFVGFSLLDIVTFGTWGAPLTPAVGILLLLLAPEFFQPLRDVAAAWHDKAAADAVADEFASWAGQDSVPLLGKGEQATPLPGPAHVTLSAARLPTGAVLPELAVTAGESVALVGPSGAGKTTILRLLSGLLHLPGAQVTVAGQPLDDRTADQWRSRIGWMPQEPHFLNASLRRNIDMGRPQAGDIDHALQQAALAPVIAQLPQGLNTRLGESGAGLSGGEGRRVILTRALFSRPDLILADEPTADLDTATARQITAALLAQVARGATLIVATHDMQLAGRMDRIITLGGNP